MHKTERTHGLIYRTERRIKPKI